MILHSLYSREKGRKQYGQCTDLTRQHYRTVNANPFIPCVYQAIIVSIPMCFMSYCCEDYVLLEGTGMPVEPETGGVRQETTEGLVHMDRGKEESPVRNAPGHQVSKGDRGAGMLVCMYR